MPIIGCPFGDLICLGFAFSCVRHVHFGRRHR
jgi:hypothetical protein